MGRCCSFNALVVDEVSMAQYQVTFFKDLLSSCGTPVRCMQRCVEIREAVSPADAAVSHGAARIQAVAGRRRFGDFTLTYSR